MDFSFVVGLFFGALMILIGNKLEHGELRDMIGGPAAIIVFGGTLGAVLVHATLRPFAPWANGSRCRVQAHRAATEAHR